MKVTVSFDEMCVAIREYVNRKYKNYHLAKGKGNNITIFYNAGDEYKFRAEVKVDMVDPKEEDSRIPEALQKAND